MQREDDENFLLDDKISNFRDDESLPNGATHSLNEENEVIEDLGENFEDLPLLLNDCVQAVDEHHIVFPENEDKKAWKKLLIIAILCFLFMIAELIGGIIAGSLAIMTDAAHLFSDFIGFLISLLSIWISCKSPTSAMTFGFLRAEVLGAFISVLTIWLLAMVFVVVAINRIWKNEYDIDVNAMILVASLGLFINIIMAIILYGSCHNHSHGLREAKTSEKDNINVRAAAAHIVGDLLQSTGVLIAAIIIKVFPNAHLADPICTLLFSAIVICSTARVLKDSMWILLEGSPQDTTDLKFKLESIPSVRHIRNLHVWSLSPGKHVVSVHLSIDKHSDTDSILSKASFLLKENLNVISSTIQVELDSCK